MRLIDNSDQADLVSGLLNGLIKRQLCKAQVLRDRASPRKTQPARMGLMRNLPKENAEVNSQEQTVRILRIREVTALVGMSAVTLWRHEREGRFPRRIQLSGSGVGWRSDEIQEWILNRPRVGLAQPGK